MGNSLDNGEYDLSKYQIIHTLRDEVANFDVLRDDEHPQEFLITKDFKEIYDQHDERMWKHVIERISQQPNWYTLMKFQRVVQSRDFEQYIGMTKVYVHTLAFEVQENRKANRVASDDRVWAVFTNLFLATMDMEHRLDFHNTLGMDTIFIDESNQILISNPYMRDRHLRQIMEHIIEPAHAMGVNWKPDYEKRLDSRLRDLESNQQLRAIHKENQIHIQDTLKCLALIALGLLNNRSDSEYLTFHSSGRHLSNLKRDLITADIQVCYQFYPESRCSSR